MLKLQNSLVKPRDFEVLTVVAFIFQPISDCPYGQSEMGWKIKATKAWDKLRRQTFIERKTRCSGFPFFGLEDDEFRHEMVNKVDWQDVKLVRKLR